MMRIAWVVAVVVSVWLTAVCSHPGEYDVQDPGHFLNSFLIQVTSRDIAERVAQDHGFELLERLDSTDYYHLSHSEVVSRSRRSSEDYVDRLRNDERVSFVEQQITLKRVKRTHQVIHDKQLDFHIEPIKDNSKYYRTKTRFDSRSGLDHVYNDQYFDDQWYLLDTGQAGRDVNPLHMDMNVVPVWEKGITGKGVVVCVLDDGLDRRHEDLKRNYDPKASSDFNDADADPTPDKATVDNNHGTRCAGEIAAQADNGICGVGVAYDCSIGGIRMLDGQITDRLEAKALLFNRNYVAIYSASWGPRDDGRTMEGLKRASADALEIGVTQGRNGLGNIYVWATGNGGDNCDHCGADGYVSSIYSISINSLGDRGHLPYFGERCSSTMAAVPSGGEPTRELEIEARNRIKVVTTDINNGCIENFEGTSSAAPLAAGCLALLLQAAPMLTWRDVQHLVANYSRIPIPDKNEAWVINGAGYHVNPKMGFGLLDCGALVKGAEDYTNVPEHHMCETNSFSINVEIPRSGCHKLSITFDGCQEDPDSIITYLEHVEVEVELTAPRRGDMEIFLTSPAGTRSELLGRRCNDDSDEGINFKFMTVHSWMENPRGEWSLEVCHNNGESTNEKNHGTAGTFKRWQMRAFGFHKDQLNKMKKSYTLSSEKLVETAHRELIRSTELNLKRINEAETKKDNIQDDDRALKDLETLFDSFDKVFGEPSKMDKNHARKPISRQQQRQKFYSRGKKLEEMKKAEMSDREMEVTIDELLEKLDGRDASSLYLKEILEKKRAEMRKERLQHELVAQIKWILDEQK